MRLKFQNFPPNFLRKIPSDGLIFSIFVFFSLPEISGDEKRIIGISSFLFLPTYFPGYTVNTAIVHLYFISPPVIYNLSKIEKQSYDGMIFLFLYFRNPT